VRQRSTKDLLPQPNHQDLLFQGEPFGALLFDKALKNPVLEVETQSDSFLTECPSA
jgi:hypothetical protein